MAEHIFFDLDISVDFEMRELALHDLEKRIWDSPSDYRNEVASFAPVSEEHQLRIIKEAASTVRLIPSDGLLTDDDGVIKVSASFKDLHVDSQIPVAFLCL